MHTLTSLPTIWTLVWSRVGCFVTFHLFCILRKQSTPPISVWYFQHENIFLITTKWFWKCTVIVSTLLCTTNKLYTFYVCIILCTYIFKYKYERLFVFYGVESSSTSGVSWRYFDTLIFFRVSREPGGGNSECSEQKWMLIGIEKSESGSKWQQSAVQ